MGSKVTVPSWSGGVLNKGIFGDAPPRGPTPYPFIYHFWQKRNLFHMTSIEKWYPFILTSAENSASPLTAVKSTFCLFFTMNKSQPKRFFDFFTAVKCLFTSELAVLGLLQTKMTADSLPVSLYFSLWNPYPFIYLKPEKGTPFGRSLPI